MAKPQVFTQIVSPTHKRFGFAENLVCDVKLEEISPGKSAMNFYLNGLLYSSKAHPIPSPGDYPRDAEYQIALEGWAAGIYDNPTGE